MDKIETYHSSRIILHIDMNSFFASVEQKANPFLRGKPIVVCGNPRGRSVVLTASYEAKAYGVKTGMLLWEAKKLCPRALLVEAHSDKYEDVSVRLFNIYKSLTPLVEIFSVDEAFLDISGTERLWGSPKQVALKIKQRIKEEVGITCSIGIAHNKLLAKLASDLQKPDGLVILLDQKIPDLLDKIPIQALCGIGPRLGEHLNKLGIHTCGQLARFPVEILEEKFGKVGLSLSQMGKGEGSGKVAFYEDKEPVKSMGHSLTLPQDVYERETVERYLLQLSEQVARRLRRDNYQGKTVSLIVRFPDFSDFMRQKTINKFIDDGLEIFQVVETILDQINVGGLGVRLIGVSVSNLIHKAVQLGLFEEFQKKRNLLLAMDEINDRYGEFTITWSRLYTRLKKTNIISPAWRPSKHLRHFSL